MQFRSEQQIPAALTVQTGTLTESEWIVGVGKKGLTMPEVLPQQGAWLEEPPLRRHSPAGKACASGLSAMWEAARQLPAVYAIDRAVQIVCP